VQERIGIEVKVSGCVCMLVKVLMRMMRVMEKREI
jgi:hypothetical protein